MNDIDTTDSRRDAILAGLRALIGFLWARPDVPLPASALTRILIYPDGPDEVGIAEVYRIAKAMGVPVTSGLGRPITEDTTHYTAEISFGPVEFSVLYITEAYRAEHAARRAAEAAGGAS